MCLFQHRANRENGGEWSRAQNAINGSYGYPNYNFVPLEDSNRFAPIGNNYFGAGTQNQGAWGGNGTRNYWGGNQGMPCDTSRHDNSVSRPEKLCKHGRTCRNMNTGCTFRHETINKPCRNANKCDKGASCLFLHHNTEMNGADHVHTARPMNWSGPSSYNKNVQSTESKNRNSRFY